MGHVDKFVTITPKIVTLRGQVGNPIKQSVRIIPEKKYPFKIIGHKLGGGNDIRYELAPVQRSEGIEYLLTVENLRKVTGNYYNTITIKTDSNIQPSINIRVKGYILDHQPKIKESASDNPALVHPRRGDAHPLRQPE